MKPIIITRETLNGTKWEIVFTGYATLYMNGHYSGYVFNTIEEAQAHLDAVDERVKTPVKFTACEVPADYYRDCNRYFGD